MPCRYLAVSVLEVVFLRQASIARMLQADATDLARFITALSQDMTVQASTAQVVTKFFAFLGRGPNPPGLDRRPIEAAATVYCLIAVEGVGQPLGRYRPKCCKG